MQQQVITAIAAIGRDRALGKGNELLWRIPDDLKRFRQLTLGHPLILGRKTYDSIAAAVGGPLPGRQSIVVTRDREWSQAGVIVSHSVEEAIESAKHIGSDRICIGGGAQIYEAALPYTDLLQLTIVDDHKDADVYFPPYETEFTKIVHDEEREWEGLRYRWVDFSR